MYPKNLFFFNIILHLSLSCCLFLFQAQARWATSEDAPIELVYYNRDVTVEANGRSEEIIEYQMQILNEVGRDQFGTERLYYNGDTEEIQILEAKCVFQGKEYIVPETMIEIKPLASDPSGFDQKFQVLISFPKAEQGAKLYLKYKLSTRNQPLEHYFSTDFHFGRMGIWKKSRVTLKSKIPFFIMVNDPRQVLEIQETKSSNNEEYQVLNISLQKPIYEEVINEPYYSLISDDLLTWVTVSTVDNFKDLGKALARDYENVINQPLPPLFAAIHKSAQGILDPVEQLNRVTSMLAERVRYMGDWRSINGKFFPRPLDTIAESGLGDCKDFSVVTAAILNKLGYRSKVALVNRSVVYLAPIKTLPSINAFNHAMVKVTNKQGKNFWIDPTNTVSMADGIFPDIANRPTLVLDAEQSFYQMIPAIDFNRSRINQIETLRLKNDELLMAQGHIKLQGEKVLDFAGAGLFTSLQSLEERFIYSLSGEKTPVKKSLTLPDLKSRICQDLDFEYSYHVENATFLTNIGEGISLDSNWINSYLESSEDQVGTSYIGDPSTISKTIIIKDVQVDNLDSLNYIIKTPWIEATRTCHISDKHKGIEVNEIVTVLKSYITAGDIKTTAYKDLKNKLKRYCSGVILIVNERSRKGKSFSSNIFDILRKSLSNLSQNRKTTATP